MICRYGVMSLSSHAFHHPSSIYHQPLASSTCTHQVEVARKMMFEAGPTRDDSAGLKRNSRRETWCPGGKGGWQAPPGAGAESVQVLGRRHCFPIFGMVPCIQRVAPIFHAKHA